MLYHPPKPLRRQPLPTLAYYNCHYNSANHISSRVNLCIRLRELYESSSGVVPISPLPSNFQRRARKRFSARLPGPIRAALNNDFRRSLCRPSPSSNQLAHPALSTNIQGSPRSVPSNGSTASVRRRRRFSSTMSTKSTSFQCRRLSIAQQPSQPSLNYIVCVLYSSFPTRFNRSRSPRRSRSRSRSMSRERDRDRRSRSGSRDRR